MIPDRIDHSIALDLMSIAIDPAIPYTRAIGMIAERIGEIRKQNSPSPAACPPPPLAGRPEGSPLQDL